MKKIMFNDKYGLTDAVLNGKKTMTRRIIKDVDLLQYINELDDDGALKSIKGTIVSESNSRYKVDEIVAVAQSYSEVYDQLFGDVAHINNDHALELHMSYILMEAQKDTIKGWTNKMFVRPDLMPHHIRITDTKVERLQDISEEDVYKEAFTKEFVNNGWGNAAYHEETILVYYDKKGMTKTISSRNPKEAFSSLIDKLCGVGTWDSNPCVFVYSFKLID